MINIINNQSFFNENNSKSGVMTKSSFLNHLSMLTVLETRKLEKLFSDLKNGVPIQISPFDYTTEEGEIKFVYINLRFVNGGGTSYTVTCFKGFERFRTLLTTHRFEIDFDGLVAEATAEEEDIKIIKSEPKPLKKEKV